MPEEVMIIALAGIIFGTGLVGLILTGIYKLIRAKIDQGNKGTGEINPQFFKALGEFKKNTERRISNLEAIVSDLEEERYRIDDGEKQDPEIEIETEDVRSPDTKENEADGNLRNMLNE